RRPRELNLRTFTANVHAFSILSFMRRVYRNRLVSIYRVRGLASRSPLPRPTAYPGYRCERGVIEAAGNRGPL
ncbi:MAG: hypothetical protein M3P18_12830, partial [Actinomycetota bacterium]|nr:hypothetical protein [Actinomycetota bacterium]